MKKSSLSVPVTPVLRVARHLVGFSRREVRGFGLLLAGLALLVVLPALVGRWLQAPAAPVVTTEEVHALDRLAARLEQAEQEQRRARYPPRDARPWEPRGTEDGARAGGRPRRAGYAQRAAAPVAQLKTLAPFDPNALSALDWQRRGVPADVARRIVSYGRKAGGFRYREQLARIHGLAPHVLARLTPFMQLPARAAAADGRPAYSSRPAGASLAGAGAEGGATAPAAFAAPRAATNAFRKPRVVQPFDLNTADTLALMQLRGIGQRRAARIVELREKLGGFVSAAQLADVWGLDPALVDSVAKYGRIAPDFHPRPLALNSASMEELRAHPYVGPRLARVITAFREQHGPFARPEDLLQIKILDAAAYRRLEPYLALP